MNKLLVLATLSNQDLFEIKQKFLREIPHPKLILKQINKLSGQKDISGLTEMDPKIDLKDYLKEYLNQLMPLKLNISNARSEMDLKRALQQLYCLQNGLIQKLYTYFTTDVEIDDSEIKQSAPMDVYIYLKEIESQNVKESDIKNYLCRQFKNDQFNKFTDLAKAVLQARKIEEYE